MHTINYLARLVNATEFEPCKQSNMKRCKAQANTIIHFSPEVQGRWKSMNCVH